MQEVQNKLISFYRSRRRMPTYAEMTKLFGYRSKGATRYAVQKLIEEGVVSKDRTGNLIPRKLYGEIPYMGYVKAGFPSPAEEELIDTMDLNEYLITNPDAVFLFTAEGDSMIDAGILDGDLLLVERGKEPRPGDIVIAEIEREYTAKYYRKRGNQVYLEAANENYPPIHAKEIIIAAVVQAVIRRFRR